MASALAIVALAGWLQMVTLGESPSHTETVPVAGSGGSSQAVSQSAEQQLGDRRMATVPLVKAETAPGNQEPSHLDLYFPDHIVEANKMVAPEPVATVAAASVGQLSEEQARDVLRDAGAPQEWIPDMLVIAWCESKYSPGAVGDSGNSLGWFQLWSGWFHAGEDPFDALTNARVAVRVRETRGRFGGAGGWSCAGLNAIP